MDAERCWELLERSRTECGDRDGRQGWLIDQLAGLSAGEIVGFQACLDQLHDRVDSWLMWGAAYRICDGLCSDDGFWYFHLWLLGLGREVFERVAADPDALADLPQVRALAGRGVEAWADDEWPDWEALDYVAAQAYERVTGVEDGVDAALAAGGYPGVAAPDPVDEQWDFDDPEEMSRRLPRVARLFPPSGAHHPAVRAGESVGPVALPPQTD